MRGKRATCLERVLVLQAWHSAHGRPLEVVVGFNGSSRNFRAHAWLEGDEGESETWQELVRLAPP